ncbi:MAG: CoA transferase [Rhodospirillaceae bacterium]|nr:CoA transferase [Rhodospirillaceae bacterium]
MKNLKVLDISTIIAGATASTMLSDFGADVIKVELPSRPDGLRQLPPHKDGEPLWWKVTNRNKRCITLDVKNPEGAALFKSMLPKFDVLVENFRPGTLEKWGLGPDELHKIHPALTILRVSAYGQKGPYAARPGFARVGEAMSGFQTLVGDADGPPTHPGYPIADPITGLYGTIGILLALLDRRSNPQSAGQVIDVSLVESMFRMLDFLTIEYDQLGAVRGRIGNRNPYAAPGNVYRTKDDRWVTIPASTQALFERLMKAVGRPDLAEDPRYDNNPKRVENPDELEHAISTWMEKHDVVEACRILNEHQVANAPVSTIEDLFEDPHYEAANMIVDVPDEELGQVRMQGVAPRLDRTPGQVYKTGPAHGADNDDVYAELLDLSAEEIAALRDSGVI